MRSAARSCRQVSLAEILLAVAAVATTFTAETTHSSLWWTLAVVFALSGGGLIALGRVWAKLGR